MSRSRLFVERVLPLSILVLAMVAVPWLIFSPSGLGRLNRLRAEQDDVAEEISRLSDEIRSLRAEVARLRDDPRAIERAARDELGLVRQTEVVFQFSN
jgi:cell division protein FtsB